MAIFFDQTFVVDIRARLMRIAWLLLELSDLDGAAIAADLMRLHRSSGCFAPPPMAMPSHTFGSPS